MSKIALSGPASGTATYTISAPTGATDRTITLPDQTATLITNSSGVLDIGSGQLYKDASGNLGLGVTPSAWGSTRKAFQLNSGSVYATTAGDTIGAAQNAYNDGTSWKYVSNGYATSYYQNSGGHYFNIAASGTAGNTISFTQAMTLDAAGTLLVNATAQQTGGNGKLSVAGGSGGVAATLTNNSNASAYTTEIYNYTTSTGVGSGRYVKFAMGSTPTQTGSIIGDGTNTAYNTSSDYRLKENVAPMTGALALVMQQRPVTWTWKTSGKPGKGFIAHWLQEDGAGECVSGEKDAVDADGNPDYQGVDTSFLIATLTAAIQEQQAIITSLTARVTALEGTQP